MTGKFIFSMQIMFLGLSVVMVVLFTLYGLMVLFNRFFSRMPAKKEDNNLSNKDEKPVTIKSTAEDLPPQLVAAISAAVYCYRTAHTAPESCERFQEKRPNMDGSRWLAAARRDIMESRERLVISRRDRT